MKYFKQYYIFHFILTSIFFSFSAKAQLVVTTAQPAAVLAATLAGPGVTILSPTLTCPGVANGTFTSTGTLLSMSNGIVLTNGHASACSGAEGPLVSYNNGVAGDPAMTALLPTGINSYDACTLEFDMIASGDSIGFNYQFGSEEYRTAVCSEYTDIFAFFISGPGITGSPNIALVPGTTVPVEVNSVNDGVAGTSGGATLSNCTSLGPGSPYTAYYIDNTGGTQLTYRGYTTKFRAAQAVTACDTYHLKLCIVDAGNATYDSGVFLEGSSLTTNTYTFNRSDSIGSTINGVPHSIVKGCTSTMLYISAAHSNPTSTVIPLSFAGTAINGIDVTAIPSTVTLPADSTSVGINIAGIATPVYGPKTLIIYIGGACGILDSILINILDTPFAYILTPDTSVCLGASFPLRVNGSAEITYNWAPPLGLSSTTAMQPVCTPAVNTIYTMTATLPGSGCAEILRTVAVNIGSTVVTILTSDTAICYGSSVNLRVIDSSASDYSWLPSAGLNNAHIEDPTATPSATTTYTVTAVTTVGSCNAIAEVTITVNNPEILLLTPDTSVCAGAPINIRVNGNPLLTYSWTPALSLSDPYIMQPMATPSVTTNYILTTTYPGTSCTANAAFTANIIQIPIAASWKIEGCNQSLNLSCIPTDTNYSYSWTGPAGFTGNVQDPVIINPTIANSGIYTVTVVDNANACSALAIAAAVITPDSAKFLTNVTPNQTITFGSTVQLNADNATYYWWMPDNGSLNNRNINDPVATPVQNTTYTVYGSDSSGCVDSASITIDVTYDSISIPSAFTPNNDGLNDIFRPAGMKYQKLVELNVYNRWGQLVFTSGSNQQGWDGTFNGVPQEMGVYNYILIVALSDGNNVSYKGSVTLIR